MTPNILINEYQSTHFLLGTGGEESVGIKPMENLAERIKFLMKKRGMNEASLVKATGLPQQTVSHIIKNRIKSPVADKFHRIVQALGTTHEWLLYETGPMNSSDSTNDCLWEAIEYTAVLARKHPDLPTKLFKSIVKTALAGGFEESKDTKISQKVIEKEMRRLTEYELRRAQIN